MELLKKGVINILEESIQSLDALLAKKDICLNCSIQLARTIGTLSGLLCSIRLVEGPVTLIDQEVNLK